MALQLLIFFFPFSPLPHPLGPTLGPDAALVVSHLLAHKASSLLSPVPASVHVPTLLRGRDPRLVWFGEGIQSPCWRFSLQLLVLWAPLCLSQSSQQLSSVLFPVLFKACGRALRCLPSLDAELELGCWGLYIVTRALLVPSWPLLSESHSDAPRSLISFYFSVLGHNPLPTSHPATIWTSNLPRSPILPLVHLPLLLFPLWGSPALPLPHHSLANHFLWAWHFI